MSQKILSSVACNLDADILAACYPLLEESRVEAIEWSFDALYKRKEIPAWFTDLLQAYSKQNRLIGHGVFFSLFSGKWMPEQEEWLRQLKQLSTQYTFNHITEHFGFMTGADFHYGAPLNIPYSATTLAIGRDRLARIYDACGCPVGLENLAFSYSLDEVKRHGAFLQQLIEPINGFIIFDLHNLYCQLHNFNISFDDIINLYPLDRVREIHISGGSWEDSIIDAGRTIRRDTHDDGVPEEVFSLLERTIDKCPNLKFVVMEQLGNGLKTAESKQRFYNDFISMQQIVSGKQKLTNEQQLNTFLPALKPVLSTPSQDETLHLQQLELSYILETAANYDEASHQLRNSSLANTEWHIEEWATYMVETAMSIAQKWKR